MRKVCERGAQIVVVRGNFPREASGVHRCDVDLGSHRSAAFLWGAERPVEDPIDIILPQRHGVRDFLASWFIGHVT